MKAWTKRALAPAVRFATRRGARVLMYHRFGSEDADRRLSLDLLEQQLRHLRRHFHVVPLRDLVSRLKAGRDPEPGTVALTVDDGYLDFGALAYPVFLRNRMPVTLYVVSERAHGRLWLWWDGVRHIVTRASPGRYSIERDPGPIPLSDAASRRAAWARLADLGLTLAPDELEAYLRDLERSFSVDLPYPPPPEFAGMDWAALRNLDPEWVEIGAHTRTHPILSRCSPERIRQEVSGSKADIEERLGREVRSFCYPNGTRLDVNERCVATVREAGYDSAVMSCGGLAGRGSDVHALPRMSALGSWDFFLGEVSGFSHLRAPRGR